MIASRISPSACAPIAALMVVLATAPFARANPVKADHVQVSLIARQASIQPGGILEVGLRFQLDEHWHIYWSNPGDSGQPPRVRWDLPDGFSPNEIQWPAPYRIASGPLVNFGYEGDVVLPISIDIDGQLPGITPGQSVSLRAQVSWLVCAETCIPGKADLVLQAPMQLAEPARDPGLEPLFARAHAQLPEAIEARIRDDGEHLLVHLPRFSTTEPGLTHTLFALDLQAVDAVAPQSTKQRADGLTIRVKKDDTRTDPLTALSGIVVAEQAAGQGKAARQGNIDRPRRAYAFSATLEAPAAPAGKPVAVAATIGAGSSPQPTPPPRSGHAPNDDTGFLLALVLAFAGGLLLNLMPCVFPVLSLKVFGFCEHAHDRKVLRQHGWAYTAGVLVSFWLLAAVLLVVRAGSQSLGWGFQLQSPIFVALLAGFIFLFGLNLLGAFEIGLALSRLGGVGGGQKGLAGSFLTGVLASVVATPCTAPFMGVAVGWALTQPTLSSLSVFTALALGMAAPYVTLSYFPRLLARLPRPGRWMETLRQAMSFPLFATVVWLLAVFAQLTGPMAVFELLAGMLVAAIGAWVLGRYQSSARRPALAWALAALLLIGGAAIGIRSSGSLPAKMPMATDGMWEPWSPERVAALRAEGKPVFVNFTAAWCISCKANEIMVFSADEIRSAFASRGITTLKADWTNPDDAIAAELQAHGRAGVPLYLYYPPGGGDTPQTLPSVLTSGIVLSYLGP